MATTVGLKFYKLPHYTGELVNTAFTSALAVNGALVYATDSNEVWIGGSTPVCVVKGATKVEFNDSSKQLTIKSPVANGLETTQTLDFKDVASATGVFAVFEKVYDIIGTTADASSNPTISYAGTHYLADLGTEGKPAKNLVNADTALDAEIYRLDQAIGGNSVVNSIDGHSGEFVTTNGLSVSATSGSSDGKHWDLNIVPEENGYIVTSQTVSGVSKTGINIADSKIDKDYHTNGTVHTATNLATVGTVTAALDTLDVSTDTGSASVSGSAITINAVQQENGKIKNGGTTTINLEGTYNASTNKIATQSTVSDAIGNLDVTEYAQAEIDTTTSQTETTFKVKGIKEEDGEIAAGSNTVDLKIEGTYDASDNKIATQSTVSTAIAALDASTVATATTASVTGGSGTVVTIKGVSETDGVIAQGTGTNTVTIGDGALKLSGYGATANSNIPDVSATDVFSANDTADSTIALSNAFVLDATSKTIGIRTNQAIAADNNIATMKDIASLTGAMHYIGGVTAYPTPTADTKAGDTYVVTAEFTEGGVKYEVGDMLVANANGTNATYTVVQSNVTLGVSQGQVAANSAALTSGNIVIASGTGVETGSYSLTNLATHNVAVSSSNEVVTITDTLTVGGTAQSSGTQAFSITGGNALTASASGNDITINHDAGPSNLTPAAVKVAVDSYGHAQTGDALASTDISHSATIGSTAVSTVGGAINALETLAEGALQSISHGTDGSYVTTTIGTEDANHDQSVGVAVTIQAVSSADSTHKGLAEASDVKNYVDGQIDALDVTEFALAAKNSSTNVITIHGISETNGEIAVGSNSANDVTLAAVAATGAAGDVSYTNTTSGLEATNTQAAIDELNTKITNANITIDGHKGAITTGNGLTDVAADDGSFAVKIDSTNANGLSVGANGVAMAKATGNSFGTVEVTAGNGLTLTNGVVAYAHNTTALTIASKSGNAVTINGTFTPDASDAVTMSNPITLANVAATGAAADVSIADEANFTATTVEGALTELKGDIAGLNATIDNYTASGNTITYDEGNNVAVQIVETAGKLSTVTANLYWEAYE